MEVSELFSFLTILKGSIKLLSKNGMLFTSIATLSSILPSILLLSFISFYQSITDYVNASFIGPDDNSRSRLRYWALLLFVEIACLIIYLAISHISGIATILVSSASYTGNSLSPKQLFSSIKRTWRKPLSAEFRYSSQSSTRYLSILVFVGVLMVMMYPNAFTISTAVGIAIGVFGFCLYSSVVSVLSLLIIVLDESTSLGKAVEKAGNLVEGNQMKGFMLNLFVNFVCLIVLGLTWVVLSDEGWSVNLGLYVLIFLNVVSIMRMVVFVAYTVLYYHCKKERGESIDGVANAEYAKLQSTIGDSDFP